MTLPPDLLAEFASTYQEWHYLAGGFAAGTVFGVTLPRMTAAVTARVRGCDA